MTQAKARRSGADVVTNADVRPFEDSFDRERRQARELRESTDRAIEASRQQDDRKAAYAVYRPRYEALRRMAHETVAHRSTESVATRRAALRRHPVYLSLPESERRAWDILVDEWTETIRGGDLGTVWRHVGQVADAQASSDSLADWSAPAEAEDPAALAAVIPRG